MKAYAMMLAIPLAGAAGTVGCAGSNRTPAPEGSGAASGAAEASLPPGTITGTVTYRERIGLPADAVVQVQLLDVSGQDAAATTVAEATVRPEGRQVPLPFELPYDPAAIEPRHQYSVRATIFAENRLMFTTTSTTPVLTDGHPSTVHLMLSRAGGAADVVPNGPGELTGTSWILEDVGGAGVIDNALATLEFPSQGKVAGRGTCNRFFGSVQITAGAMAFGPLGATRMACPDAVMNQESRYLQALEAAERYRIDGGTLYVYVKGMDQPLRFTRAGP